MLIPVDPSDPDVYSKPMAELTPDERRMVGGLDITSDMMARVILGHQAKATRSVTQREEVMEIWAKIASGNIMAK